MKGQDYRKVRDKAADIGNIAHKLIECEIKGIIFDPEEYSPSDVDKAENAFLAWLEWKNNFHLETVGSELQLVSEKYRYGGTLDWIARHDGQVWLVDFKSSKGIYDEMKYQLAAYQWLYNENNPDNPINQCPIIKLGKEDGNFEHHQFRNLEREFKIFLHCLDEQEPVRRTFVEHWAHNDKRAYRQRLKAIINWDVEARLAEIQCPVLVVASDEDYVPLEEKRAYTAKIPNARLVVIEDARHAVTAECPGEFNKVVEEFLAGCMKSPG